MRLLEANETEQGYDLYYGDSTTVSEQGYVPYGWQFADEDLAIEVCRGKKVNVFGLYNRQNDFHFWIKEANINSVQVIEMLDEFSWRIKRPTLVVLDNASPHRSKKVNAMFDIWRQRGLYIFFLPPYSPQLNLIERLWKELKEGWLQVQDYQSTDKLFYALWMICSAIGDELKMNTSNNT